MGIRRPPPFNYPSPFILEVPIPARSSDPIPANTGAGTVSSEESLLETYKESLGRVVQTERPDVRHHERNGAAPPVIMERTPQPILTPGPSPLVAAQNREESEMAVDWGNVLSGAVDIIQGQRVGGGPSQSFNSGGTYTPVPAIGPQETFATRDRQWCKPRRRRRRLLTEGDFNDLMRIATLPNKQNVTVALAKAVGRR